METKQTIHSTEQAANAERLAFENRSNVKGLHTGNTTSYTYTIKHPTLNKWANRWNVSGKYWDEVQAYLNPNQINNLVDIDQDWFPSDII